jgi:hypothetical protein
MKNNPLILAAIWAVSAMGMAVYAGCGGRVIVDGFPGEGGAGTGQAQGGEGAYGQGTTGQNGGGGICGSMTYPGFITFCGGSASAGTGTPVSCTTSLCDAPGNQYEANCQSNTCVCLINGIAQCSCALNGAGDFCGGTPPCCPWNQNQ